jgi:hypothetical protein
MCTRAADSDGSRRRGGAGRGGAERGAVHPKRRLVCTIKPRIGTSDYLKTLDHDGEVHRATPGSRSASDQLVAPGTCPIQVKGATGYELY